MLSILTSSHPTDHDVQQGNGQFFVAVEQPSTAAASTAAAVAATSDYSSNNSPTTGGASSPTTTTTPSNSGGGHQPTNQITDEEEEAAATDGADARRKRKREGGAGETDDAATASTSINCPFCNVLLLDATYLQRHFQEAHGLEDNRLQREGQTDYDSHMISSISGGGGLVSTNNGFNEIFNNSIMMENLFKSTTTENDNNNFSEEGKIVVENNINNNFDCKSCNCSFSSEIELWAHRRSAHFQSSSSNGAIPAPRPALTTGEVKNKIFNPEAYCDLCDKEFCNKYFLKTHKANKHGVYGGGGGPSPGDDSSSQTGVTLPSGVLKSAAAAAGAASIESQVQMAQNRLASILDAAAAAAVASSSDTPPLKQTAELDNGGSVESGEISMPHDDASAAAAALFQNLPSNFGSNFYLPNFESSSCPFCHQVFANGFLLQSHIFTFHSMAGLPPTSSASSVNPAAFYALMNASSSASFNPFLAQQLKMFGPDPFSMFSGVPTTTSAPTSTSFGNHIPDLTSFNGLDLPLVDEAKRQQTPPQRGAATAVGDQLENAALDATTTSAASTTATAALQHTIVASNVQKNGLQQSSAIKLSQQSAAAAAEAFCDLCRKVFCNKYFLRTHKLNKHGISPGSSDSSFAEATANGSPNGIHRKRAYNKTGLHSLVGQCYDFGAKVKVEGEAPNGLCIKEEDVSKVKSGNDENLSTNGALDLALFSVESTEAKKRRLTPQVSNDCEALNFSSNGPEGRADGSTIANGSRPVDLDAYCGICCKEFCSKYFLKQHKFKIHGVIPEWSPIPNRSSPGNNTIADFSAKSQNFDNQEQAFVSKLEISNGDLSGSMSAVPTAAANATTTPKLSTSARQFPSTSKNFCDICNKEVCNKYYIRTHMLKMHGVIIDENKNIIGNVNNFFDEKSKTYKCDLCGKETPNRHQLKNHIRLMHMPNNSSFFDPSNQTILSDQQDYSLKIKEDSLEKKPNFKPQIAGLQNSQVRNNRRFKNVSRWLKNDHLTFNLGDHLLQQQNGGGDVRVCEYCSLQCDDEVELQLHVIDVHQQEVNGAAEQTALDAICSLKSKNIDQSSKDGNDNQDAENSISPDVSRQNVETTAADGSLNLTRRFSRIDETIDRIVAAKEISAAAAAATTTTSSAATATINKTPTAAAANDSHLPMVARNDLGAKMYKCSYCNYYTRWISNLSTHEKRHNAGVAQTLDRNDRPFVCRICLRAYRYAHSLKRHMEVHRLSSIGMQIQMMTQSQSLPNLVQNPIVAPVHSTPVSATGESFVKNQSLVEKMTPLKTPSSSLAKNFSSSMSNTPQKIAYVCSFCDKQFRNRELYRMHLFIIHKTSPPKDFKQQQSTVIAKNCSPTKKAYNCKICGLSTKIYDILREHMEKVHGTVPRIANSSGDWSPATGVKKNANDSCNSPLNLKTSSNFGVQGVGSAVHPPPLSSAPLSLVLKSSQPTPDRRRIFSVSEDVVSEIAVAKKGSVSPTSDSSENEKRRTAAQPQPPTQPYIMQAFFIKETSPLTSEMTSSSPFVPGVVYLPVLRHLDAPFDAKFSLFPIDRDDLSPADSQLDNEMQAGQSP